MEAGLYRNQCESKSFFLISRFEIFLNLELEYCCLDLCHDFMYFYVILLFCKRIQFILVIHVFWNDQQFSLTQDLFVFILTFPFIFTCYLSSKVFLTLKAVGNTRLIKLFTFVFHWKNDVCNILGYKWSITANKKKPNKQSWKVIGKPVDYYVWFALLQTSDQQRVSSNLLCKYTRDITKNTQSQLN